METTSHPPSSPAASRMTSRRSAPRRSRSSPRAPTRTCRSRRRRRKPWRAPLWRRRAMGDTGTRAPFHLDRRDQLRAGHRAGQALQRRQPQDASASTSSTGRPGCAIQQRRVDSSTGDEVAYEDIVKGYELAPDRYVVIDAGGARAARPEEDADDRHRGLRRPRPTSTRSSTTTRTTSRPARAAPSPTGCCWRRCARPTRSRSPGSCIRSKEQLVAIRPIGRRAGRWRRCSSPTRSSTRATIDELPDADEVETSERELDDRQAADRLAGRRLRAREVPRHVPRGGARPDRDEGRRRGDRRAARDRGGRAGARPDGGAEGQSRRGPRAHGDGGTTAKPKRRRTTGRARGGRGRQGPRRRRRRARPGPRGYVRGVPTATEAPPPIRRAGWTAPGRDAPRAARPWLPVPGPPTASASTTPRS